MRLMLVGRLLLNAGAPRQACSATSMLPRALINPTQPKLAAVSCSAYRSVAGRSKPQGSPPALAAYSATFPQSRGYSTDDKPHPLRDSPNVHSPLRDTTKVTDQDTAKAHIHAVEAAKSAGTPGLASPGTASTASPAAGVAGTSAATSASAPIDDKPHPLGTSTNVDLSGVNTDAPSASRYPTGASSSMGTESSASAGSSTGAGPSTGAVPGFSPDTTASPSFDSQSQQESQGGRGVGGLPRLVVFGGNGFVGTRVCEQALKTGLTVVSISRSGRPKALDRADWADSVEWIQADAFQPETYRYQLKDAVGVVSCLGGFGSNDHMLKICGEANILAMNEAARAGVGRFAFISVHDYRFPDVFLSGYFQGKRNAERALANKFPDSGVALRPGFIHGTRSVGSISIPLGVIGMPLEKALGVLPTKSLVSVPLLGAGFVPPVSVNAVAKAAVAAATDPAIPAGIMDVWEIARLDATSG